MRITCLTCGLLVCLSGAAGCDKPDLPAAEKAAPTEGSLNDLPAVLDGAGREYRVDPYLRAAVSLQSMGRERALKILKALAANDQDARVIVLCRMLFVENLRRGTAFRQPGLGRPSFVGGEPTWNDGVHWGWPLEPIALVEGVPFLVVRGYLLGGARQSSADYLAFCVAKCDWSGYRFKLKSPDEKKAALEAFRSLPQVQGKLDRWDVEFLEAQLK